MTKELIANHFKIEIRETEWLLCESPEGLKYAQWVLFRVQKVLRLLIMPIIMPPWL